MHFYSTGCGLLLLAALLIDLTIFSVSANDAYYDAQDEFVDTCFEDHHHSSGKVLRVVAGHVSL